MAFPFNRPAETEPSDARKPARSPLAGWFGLKGQQAEADALPAMDVAGGLNRALRLAGAGAAAREQEQVENASDPIRDALGAIEAALYTIDRIRDAIEQAYEVALSAQDVEDVGGRALLAESYDDLRLSINAVIEGADERAQALIGKSQRQIDVRLGGKAHYSVSPTRLDISPKGLDINPPRDAFATFEEIAGVLEELDGALRKADRAASAYCRDAQFLIARLEASEAA